MATEPRTNVWPSLRYQDPITAMKFLVDALGFVQTALYQDDNGAVMHAEMRWPAGGGIMLGGAREDSTIHSMPTGTGAIYLVADSPAEVDALFKRAQAANADVIAELSDTDYGSRDFGIRDPEGVFWSIGTYAGE